MEDQNPVDNIQEEAQENSQVEEHHQVQGQVQQVKKKTYLDCILNKLEKLKEIQLDFIIRKDNFPQYKTNCDKFKGITHLSMETGQIRREDLLFLSSIKLNPWNLTHLTWTLYANFDKNLVRKCLLRVSDTLKYFDVHLHCNLTPALPWLNDWYVPEELVALETLKLRGTNAHMVSCLAIALQLPKLKKICMPNPPTNLKKRISEWEKSPLAKERKLTSDSIIEVELGENITAGRRDLINGTFWPQFKTLKVGTISTNVMTKKLIQNWKNLERLELDFSSATGGDLDKIEQWLTGKVFGPIYNESGSESDDDEEEEDKKECSFKSLTNLKCLTVHNSRVFTDPVINNSLLRMKLQTIRFRDCMISQQGMDKLKKELTATAILMDSVN